MINQSKNSDITTPIECVRVTAIHNHPNADKLEIVKFLRTQVCAPTGDFQIDDLVVYFPPDVLIPETVAEELGVKNYLKHAVYPGNEEKTQCRIGAIRLRQIPSVGFLIKFDRELQEGDDLTKDFGGEKYNPPMQGMQSGDLVSDTSYFPRYTTIQHYYKYADVLPEGLPVRITEKIHGTNSRVGLVDGRFMCGTRKTNRAEFDTRRRRSHYWQPMTEPMENLLRELHSQYDKAFDSVVVYGEIFGNQVQSLDYGVEGTLGYRVFDIAVGGVYLDWEDIKRFCDLYGIQTVPLLYEGPFRPELVEELMNGPTKICGKGDIKSSFKGREGIVITPLKERCVGEFQFPSRDSRLILKAVSPDYYQAMK